ncbi:MAG TPA: c-type cytochrome [Kofleriaceae bacterium]|nr:c-type cytochrome [Kofleriaceae bacterium]
MLCTRGHAALLAVTAAAALAACGGARSDNSPSSGSNQGQEQTAPAPQPPPDVDPSIALGRTVYGKYCALCHGPEAKGYAADNAPSLVSRTFLESADDTFIARSIELGRPGTAMAAYGTDLNGPLGERDIKAVVAFLRDLGDVKTPIAAPAPMAGDATRGKELYTTMCQQCHGDPAARSTAVHLANPTFLALASDGFLRYAIVFGRPGTPMEPFASKIDGAQVADVITYLRSWSKPSEPKPPGPTPGIVDGPVVINPKGKAPSFTLRDDRFVPAAQVNDALGKKQRMVIIDARPASDFVREHIPGSISVPHYELDKLDTIPKDGTVVIAYCACPHHASGIVVDELLKRGYKRAYVLDEGILFWRKQGYAIAGTTAASGAAGVPAPPPMPHAHDHAGHSH